MVGTKQQRLNILPHKSVNVNVIAMIHHTFILCIFNATYVEETLQVAVVLSRDGKYALLKIHFYKLCPLLSVIQCWQSWEIDGFPAFWQRVELTAPKKKAKQF